MTSLRRFAAVMALSGASIAAGVLGFNYVQEAQFARAQERVESTRKELSTVQDLASVFRSVGKVVEPSVVNIDVTKTIKGVHRGMPFDDDTLRRFFPDRDGDNEPDLPPGFGDSSGGDDTLEEIGTGSGVIMETNNDMAYILTNNHVAGGASEMTITLSNGTQVKGAKLVGADPKTDLAVVEIKAEHLIPAQWGNSDELQKGDWVLAFGSPFRFVGSMTHGIVSATNRTNVGILGSQGYEDFIQVDAPINPGNSGGPLVNIHGEVVGINTAIASRSGGFQGIGFAVPSNLAKTIYSSLRQHGKVTRGWLGVSIASVTEPQAAPVAKSFGFTGSEGVLVQETFPNTPASGKLQAGDIITKMNGKPVANANELRNAIAATSPNTDVTLTVFRDGKTQEVTIRLGDQPEDLAAAVGRGGRSGGNPSTDQATAESLGMRLINPTDAMVQRFGLETNKGALVAHVEARSAAAKAGIRPGDLITRVDGQAVNNATDAANALGKADLKKGVRLYVVSREGSRFVFLQTAEK